MFELMAYCIVIAALGGLTALAAERALAALGKPRRIAWLAALAFAVLYPLVTVVFSSGDGVTVVEAGTSLAAAQSVATDGQHAPALAWLDTALAALWGFSSVIVNCVLLAGCLRLYSLTRRLPVEDVFGYRLYISDCIGPATFGVLFPEIVVPRWLLERSASDIRLAIAHELEHVKARDAGTLLLALVLIALMPWNPILWWMLHRLRFAMEADCDRRVLAGGADFNSYGEALLAIGQHKSLAPVGAVALTEAVSQLEKRMHIMQDSKIINTKKWVLAAAFASASCAVLAGRMDPPAAEVLYAKLNLPELAAKDISQSEAEEITLSFEKIPVRHLIGMIAQFTGSEIAMHDGVQGAVSIKVESMPWDQALDLILANKGLERIEKDGVIYIQPAS